MVNRQMINSWQRRAGSVSKAWKPPSLRPILIYFEFRSKPSLITIICMDPHSPNKLFATKYFSLILGGEFLFLNHFFIFRFFLVILCYFVIINFYKNYVIIIIILFNYFFSWKLLLFFHVPGCSGMFRNVPCSGFYRRPSSSLYFWKSVFNIPLHMFNSMFQFSGRQYILKWGVYIKLIGSWLPAFLWCTSQTSWRDKTCRVRTHEKNSGDAVSDWAQYYKAFFAPNLERSVPRGSLARAWKLSSRLFSRLHWLHRGLRGWRKKSIFKNPPQRRVAWRH